MMVVLILRMQGLTNNEKIKINIRVITETLHFGTVYFFYIYHELNTIYTVLSHRFNANGLFFLIIQK